MKSKPKTQGLVVRSDASVSIGERVEVYYNIHKGGFSIKSLDKRNPAKGKVVAHAEHVSIQQATFHISKGTLAQILDTNRKSVYAVVRGTLSSVSNDQNFDGHRKGYCNPFRTGEFVDWDTGKELKEAEEVHFYDKFFSYR